ncbi:MAG: RluA family pseudouridine synthase [Candidatus Omnitrophica bacterium]|nr:RluA family pseudouridine synthase [Candidatus Omnitrophota bacterium]
MERKLVYNAGGKERIDRYLKERLNVSRERIKEFLKDGRILVNGKVTVPSRLLRPDDEITFNDDLFSGSAALIKPEPGNLEIIYSDADIVAVNKPAGVITHPTNRILTGTLVNFLLYHTTLSSAGLPLRPGVVHRLDRGTSGVIVFARTDYARENIINQFRNREVEKEYLAIVEGRLYPEKREVEFTVSHEKDNHTTMEVGYLRGKKALTIIEVAEYLGELTLVKAKPVSGRTHQIRLALAHLGYPIIGDLKYGVKSDLIGRPALHSHRIALSLPSTGKRVEFKADMPPDFLKVIKR